ncbi:MAG: (Fe-S)-binding protein [Chloroflexi bacterium]|nr:(Fe-S)-binding protein [Chloroflexota bacterium]MCI0576424.1 (Fe-S)-binding protein [Chloroflexota bacterium]MCI0643289.1 (Fe-S)-binding protein [Chloroflexota bacterium]MCI0731676.1 (Fe-S)-binding protein [Chloroflexota bacterium]
MLTLVEKVLFILLVAGSLYLTYVTFGRMIRIIRRGQGQLRLNQLIRQATTGLETFFTQGRLIRHRPLTSLFHYAVAWGFTYYFLINAVDTLEGFIPNFRFLGQTALGDVYRFLGDLLTVGVLVGVVYLLARRFVARDPALRTRDNVTLHPKAPAGIRQDSLIVGGFILLHVGSRFLGQTTQVALEGGDPAQPFANLVASVWQGMPPVTLEVTWHLFWWLALGSIFLFLPYFPYTKHAHLFMGPINFATRPERLALGALEPLNFEDDSIEQFGAARLTDLHDTHILDAFACIMCYRCQDACPAYATGKELSPAALEISKRYYIRENMAALAAGAEDTGRLLEYAISESAVWACTACGACVEVCPVGNEPMFDILDIRRNQVLMESDFPAELKGAFTGMERQGNPWGMTDDRLAWTRPLDFPVPTVEQNPNFDVLYWVGCAGAFDPGAQATARAIATVLHHAGVNFAVLGNDETCTGDSARRAGNEYLFNELAQANVETLQNAGLDKKKMVTGCPHCFHTIGKEYPALGGHFQVMHHTQLIADLVGKGRLHLKNGNVLEKTTFHDPCYLGRHNGVYEDPRDALAQAGMLLLEMDRSRSNSFCCGAGGAQMWKEEEHGRQPVSANRYDEAAATGAAVLATGCPFCARMLGDANSQAGQKMQVKDVAQVVAEAIELH